MHLISNFLSRIRLKILVKYPLILQNEFQSWVDVERGYLPYLVYFGTSIPSVSAKRMKVIYEIRLHSYINRTMENDRQFSNNLYQTLSKSTQEYGLLFLPSRMPQVLGRSPAPSSGLSSLSSSCQFYVDTNANDPNSCFPLCSIKRNKVS